MLCRAPKATVSKQEWEDLEVGAVPGFPKGVTGLFEHFYGTAGNWLTLGGAYF